MFLSCILARWAALCHLPRGSIDVVPCLYEMVVEIGLLMLRGVLKPSTVQFNNPPHQRPAYGPVRQLTEDFRGYISRDDLKIPFKEVLRHLWLKHLRDLRKILVAFPRNADLKRPVELLKRLATGQDDVILLTYTYSGNDKRREIFYRAHRLVDLYFPQRRYVPVMKHQRAVASMPSKGPPEEVKITTGMSKDEVSKLVNETWKDLNRGRPYASASDAVLEKLVMLSVQLYHPSLYG